MQMMIENPRPETSETGQAHSDMSQDKTLKDLVEALDDGDTVSEAKVYADSFFSDISTTSSVIYGDGSLKFN